MPELGWLDTLRDVLGVVHWPLTVLLVAGCIYFWRRGPERNERWQPPEPAVRPGDQSAASTLAGSSRPQSSGPTTPASTVPTHPEDAGVSS